MGVKFIVTGVPRSGTTIIAKYFNSIPGSICLNEPHEKIARSRSYSLGRLAATNGKLPIDNIINSLLLRHKMAGFKDTYVHPDCARPAWPVKSARSKLLSRYRNSGYMVVYILRDPVEVCNSMIYKRKNCRLNPNCNKADAIIDAAVRNYERYLGFIGKRIIIYSEFCDDPGQSVKNVIGDIVDIPNRFRLKNMHGTVTDKHAFNSKQVSKGTARFVLCDYQVDRIKESGVCDKYERMVKCLEE